LSKHKLSLQEKNQIAYLQKQKDELLERFIGACEEINKQISEVKDGHWIKQIEGGKNETANKTGH